MTRTIPEEAGSYEPSAAAVLAGEGTNPSVLRGSLGCTAHDPLQGGPALHLPVAQAVPFSWDVSCTLGFAHSVDVGPGS